MPTEKSLREGKPQLSFSSWIMGGPIVVRPRRHRLPPVFVTTELPRNPKTADATKIAEKPAKELEEKSKDKPEEKSVEKPAEKGNEAVSEAAATSKKVDLAKTDEASKDNEGAKSNARDTWTAEQDALILKLKAANTSWKDITAQMSLPKFAILARYKELQNLKASTVVPVAAPNTASSTCPATTPILENNNTDKNVDVCECDCGCTCGCVVDGNCKCNTVIDGDWNQDNSADNNLNQDNNGGGVGGDGFWNSNSARLRADDSWTREDCEILEMLEKRYREEKWLSIQSSFYNMTGRMIVADIIRAKITGERH